VVLLNTTYGDGTTLNFNQAQNEPMAALASFAEPGDVFTINVLPSDATSGGEFEWRTPSTAPSNADQMALIWIKSSATFQVQLEVIQCWQCHPLATAGSLFTPVPSYVSEADYDPLVIEAYQKIPQRDPRRVIRRATSPPDDWQRDLKSALQKGANKGIRTASEWAVSKIGGFFGPAGDSQEMTNEEWVLRWVSQLGNESMEVLRVAMDECKSSEIADLERYLLATKGDFGTIRILPNGPRLSKRGPRNALTLDIPPTPLSYEELDDEVPEIHARAPTTTPQTGGLVGRRVSNFTVAPKAPLST